MADPDRSRGNAPCGAPQSPGDVDRNVEVGDSSGLATRQGMGGAVSCQTAQHTSVPRACQKERKTTVTSGHSRAI